MNGSTQPPRACGRAILGFSLQASAILFGILAVASGGCAFMERNTGAREAFVYWGALKLFGGCADCRYGITGRTVCQDGAG